MHKRSQNLGRLEQVCELPALRPSCATAEEDIHPPDSHSASLANSRHRQHHKRTRPASSRFLSLGTGYLHVLLLFTSPPHPPDTPSSRDLASKMVQISEVKNQGRDNRTSAHTHIKGLGLTLSGTADKQAAGFVGQQTAREVRHATRPRHLDRNSQLILQCDL